MTDPDHDSRLAKRTARLTRMLKMSAPHSLIAKECLLVIRATNAQPRSHPGGTRWDSLRFVLGDIVEHCWGRIGTRLEMLACRVLGRHTWGAVLDEELEETGWEQCCYCDTMHYLRKDTEL